MLHNGGLTGDADTGEDGRGHFSFDTQFRRFAKRFPFSL
jgi:hypothetical protein